MAAFLVYGRAPGYRRVVFDGGMNAGACSVLETGELGSSLRADAGAERRIARSLGEFAFFPGFSPASRLAEEATNKGKS